MKTQITKKALRTKMKHIRLAIVSVALFLAIHVAIVLGTTAFARSKVKDHLGKPVEFENITVTDSGNVCFGFSEKDSILSLITYYYCLPDGDIRMRFQNSDLMLKVD